MDEARYHEITDMLLERLMVRRTPENPCPPTDRNPYPPSEDLPVSRAAHPDPPTRLPPLHQHRALMIQGLRPLLFEVAYMGEATLLAPITSNKCNPEGS